jgi:CRP/FNR family transcriptional regulator, cyclic AMP receptor protein
LKLQAIWLLRTAAIGSSIAFIIYGFYDSVHPVLVPHAILLPPNAWRAILMLRLIRRVEAASKRDLSTERLKPFMKEASLKAGETIFNKGDYADRLYGANND